MDYSNAKAASSWRPLFAASWWRPLLAVAVVALPFAAGEGYLLHLAIMSAIFAILAASLGLIVGYAGLLSLGHAAFFGIGAYTSALLFLKLGLSMWVGLLAAGLLSAAVALLLGLLILRVRGNRFVIVTVAFAEIMRLVAYNWVEMTRGQMGLPGIRAPTLEIPGLFVLEFASKQNYFFLALAIAVVAIWLMARIAKSPLGWGFVAMRENESLCESIGISAFRHALLVFTVGAFFAGVAGSLYAHYINFIGPDLFYFSYTTTMLVMVVGGGIGTIAGPVIGAVIFTIVPESLRLANEYRLVMFGSLLLVMVLFFPRGIVSLWQKYRQRLQAREG